MGLDSRSGRGRLVGVWGGVLGFLLVVLGAGFEIDLRAAGAALRDLAAPAERASWWSWRAAKASMSLGSGSGSASTSGMLCISIPGAGEVSASSAGRDRLRECCRGGALDATSVPGTG